MDGRQLDPDCKLTPTPDKCCSALVCAQSVTPDRLGNGDAGCVYKNLTYKSGETFNDSCTAICHCEEDGHVSCKPRCAPSNMTGPSDQCLTLKDSNDPCCTVLYCDVNANDGPQENSMQRIKLISAFPANSSVAMLNFEKGLEVHKLTAEISFDKMMWTAAKLHDHQVEDLLPGKTYYIRVMSDGLYSNIVPITLPNMIMNSSVCEYKGKSYKRGDEFHDDCVAYCVCEKNGVGCATIECPTDFGLDVLDPQCLDWDTQPVDFIPTPPNCCPETVTCKDNGSCIYNGERFDNWAYIPDKLTGCEQKCYCEKGNITCQPRCSPVPAKPPHDMKCPQSMAILSHTPEDECCLAWTCSPHLGVTQQHLIPGFPVHPHDQNGITVHTLEAVDEHTVRLVLSVPRVFVGLLGRVELRYTSDTKNSDPSTWEQQDLAPPNDLIATSQLEFELGNLKPNTEYKIKVSVVMRGLHNSPASEILTVKTPGPGIQTMPLPSVIPVEADLRVEQLNSTWVTLIWRKFTDFEHQFIDGVQLRYKELDGKVYQATPLIHRAVTSYTIDDLKPESHYEVGIFFIPFPGQTTELQSHKTLQISTTMENDPYKFDLTVDVFNIKSTSVEVKWIGIPYPEDKYVNIFRVIYQNEGGREDTNTFKVAKRDSPANTLIQGLKPDNRYHLWLEAYLTNGKIKKSNVQDFTTKRGLSSPDDIRQAKSEGTPIQQETDYYGSLVGVSILAAIAILAALGLLYLLVHKRGHNKAPITAAVPRKPGPHTTAYDNPSYKVEIQRETVGTHNLIYGNKPL
ncbi:hypothetical protein AAG570_012644 [Ranatra chinensis]|uniref:Epidermal cell surface receptor n=1 Tax=Ranatra chinensis TaxID=642074 RepID=A0ABD0YEI2_9HEMI